MAAPSIGDVFPADDVVARWVLSLSMLMSDLEFADGGIHETMHQTGGHVVSYFRLMTVRIYEGERIVRAVKGHKPIGKFVKGEVQDAGAYDYLRDAYEPRDGGDSLVEEAFQRSRHVTVHYSRAGGDELADIARAAAAQPAHVFLDHDNQVGRHLWPDDVMEAFLWPDSAARLEQVTLAHTMTANFMSLYKGSLNAFLARRGIGYGSLEVLTPPEEKDPTGPSPAPA